MAVRRQTIAARGLLTSQIWLKVGEHFYLLDDPPPGPRRTPELEVRARGLDDLQLVRIRVGSHAVLLDESFSQREKLGASSIGLLMGALAADTVAAIRQEAAFQGLPLRGVDVETEHRRETRYGEGPAFPSSIGDTQPFWGRVTNVRRRIRLWGPLNEGDLGPLRASALSAPVARTLACPVAIESHFEAVP